MADKDRGSTEVSTGIDRFLELIQLKGKVEDTEAAKDLGVDINTVNFWANVLENRGKIKISYSLGKTYFIWAGEVPKDTKTKTQISGEEETILHPPETKTLLENKAVKPEYVEDTTSSSTKKGTEDNEISKKLDEYSSRVDDISNRFSKLYHELMPVLSETLKKMQDIDNVRSSIGEVEGQLNMLETSLNELSEDKKKIYQDIHRAIPEMKDRISTYFNMSASIKELNAKLLDIDDRLKFIQERLGKIDVGKRIRPIDIRNISMRYSKLASAIRDMQRRYEETFGSVEDLETIFRQLESMKNTLSSSEDEILAAKADVQSIYSNISSAEKKIATLKSEVKEYSKKIEGMEQFIKDAKSLVSKLGSFKDLDKLKQELLGNISKASSEIDGLKKDVNIVKELGNVRVDFSKLKDDFIRLRRVIDEKLSKIKREIETNDEYYRSLEKTLQSLAPRIKSYDEKMEEISKNVNTLVSSAMSKIKEARGKLDNISKLSETDKVEKAFAKVKELSDISSDVEKLRIELYNLNRAISKLKKKSSVGLSKLEEDELEMRLKPIKGEGKLGSTSSKKMFALTKEEEELFRRKREELRRLLDNMVDEEK